MDQKTHSPTEPQDKAEDQATMFPPPDPAVVNRTTDAAVGIEDPRQETAGPDVVSKPPAGR